MIPIPRAKNQYNWNEWVDQKSGYSKWWAPYDERAGNLSRLQISILESAKRFALRHGLDMKFRTSIQHEVPEDLTTPKGVRIWKV